MIQPPNSLAIQLQDSCPQCSQSCQPIVVDGQSDSPTAGYHDTNGHVWFVEWKRSYTKVTNDPPLPPLESVNTVSAPGATLSTSANPNIVGTGIGSYAGTPTCKGCGSTLGNQHSPTCPLVSGG